MSKKIPLTQGKVAVGPSCSCAENGPFQCPDCDEYFPEKYTSCLEHEYDDLKEEVKGLRHLRLQVISGRVKGLEPAVTDRVQTLEAKIKLMEEFQAKLISENIRLTDCNLRLFEKNAELEKTVKWCTGGMSVEEVKEMRRGDERV